MGRNYFLSGVAAGKTAQRDEQNLDSNLVRIGPQRVKDKEGRNGERDHDGCGISVAREHANPLDKGDGQPAFLL